MLAGSRAQHAVTATLGVKSVAVNVPCLQCPNPMLKLSWWARECNYAHMWFSSSFAQLIRAGRVRVTAVGHSGDMVAGDCMACSAHLRHLPVPGAACGEDGVC